MSIATEVQKRLRSLDSYDSLLVLLETLGFTYSGEPRSMSTWPASLQTVVGDFRLAASHGSFRIFYIEISEERMLGWERQIVQKVLTSEPHSLFVFGEPEHRLWHFVHVRYDERAERRRQLRRFVVDLREKRTSERLRTTAERLSLMAISRGEQLSALEIQSRCDKAFRVSEITDSFLKSFVETVKNLTHTLRSVNPDLLPTEQEALRQAQLLMDRLVFLYFVQKKGWLNGEDDYLYNRFRECYEAESGTDTYYRERLLPVFRSLSHRDAPRPRSSDGREEALPFLNGGLFDLPLSYGTANPPTDERLRIPNDALHPVFEDFLERYNFTTSEDTPLDVEVAINPEVIGTIFETFVLTSENEAETNAPDRRKATGSYYTPRCVVHFICRAVFRRYLAERAGVNDETVKQLIEYLPADQLDEQAEADLKKLVSSQDAERLREAVVTLRACDPAVGSGAFPVGLLQEMVKLVTLLDLRMHGRVRMQRINYAHDLKKRIIEDCLYGVDIQEQAIQICELRLWLSLVVDYQTEPGLPLHERIAAIAPLPNLTFRVRVGDSLLDQLFNQDCDISIGLHHDLTGQISTVKRLYYESQSPESKRELETQVLQLQLQLLERLLERERSTQGTNLPLLEGVNTPRQNKKLEAVKERLAEIDGLLQQCRNAQRLVVQPAGDSWEHTRRFDAIRQEIGVSFVWALDFAEVFQRARHNGDSRAPGFDIIVGNPPFVTARNPEKRERYRERWPTSCFKKYHLLAPFTEVALVKLLRPQGQLAYIVSNAFATRDFGKPLLQQVLTRMELLNVVDCSGLMFPGHGTPTCILLGHAIPGDSKKAFSARQFPLGVPTHPTLLCGTRPGKGQLREEPEETELWADLEAGWETEGYIGDRMATTEWTLEVARRHPWSFNASGAGLKTRMEQAGDVLRDYLADDIGVGTMTNSEDVFVAPPEVFRRLCASSQHVRWFMMGENLRNWDTIPILCVLSPYTDSWELIDVADLPASTSHYLSHFKGHLENRLDFGSRTYSEVGRPYWEHHQVTIGKYLSANRIALPLVATHFHAAVPHQQFLSNQQCMLASIDDLSALSVQLLLALFNSSAALFWLRQVCFCKRESADPEADNYYEFAGGRVERLTVPSILTKDKIVMHRAIRLAEMCSSIGALVPGLHPRKVFELPGEGYTDWYRSIRGYQRPHRDLNLKWQSAA